MTDQSWHVGLSKNWVPQNPMVYHHFPHKMALPAYTSYPDEATCTMDILQVKQKSLAPNTFGSQVGERPLIQEVVCHWTIFLWHLGPLDATVEFKLCWSFLRGKPMVHYGALQF